MTVIPARNYTVRGDQPTKVIALALPYDCLVYNVSDTQTVYLDAFPGVTATSGTPVGPQAYVTWTKGTECYAIAGAGQEATVNISSCVGSVFDPKGIASQLYISGVPPVDVPAVLLDFVQYPVVGTYEIPKGVTGEAQDVSRYTTLNTILQWVSPVSDASTAVITLLWCADRAGLYVISQDVYHVLAATNGELALNVRTKAPYLIVSVTFASGAAVSVYMEGSFRDTVRERALFSPGAVTGAQSLNDMSRQPTFIACNFLGGAGGGPAVPAGGQITIYPSFIPGVASLCAFSSANAVVQIIDNATGTAVYQNAGVLAGTRLNVTGINIPQSQCYVNVQAAAGTTGFVTLSIQPQ